MRIKIRATFKMQFVVFFFCIVLYPKNVIAQQNGTARFHDNALGIAFTNVGTVEKIDSSSYRVTLPMSENSSAYAPLAQVSVTDRLFIDLPGSYGGRLFLDTPSASHLFQNRILADSISAGNQNFRREYWVVYAGMGMWECVINCYTKERGEYFVVSLLQNIPAGKPGEESGGAVLTAKGLQRNVLHTLQDTTNIVVKEFTSLVTSVQITK